MEVEGNGFIIIVIVTVVSIEIMGIYCEMRKFKIFYAEMK